MGDPTPVAVDSLIGWNPEHPISGDFGVDGRYRVTEALYPLGHGPTHIKAVSIDGDETEMTAVRPCCSFQGIDPIVVYVGLLG